MKLASLLFVLLTLLIPAGLSAQSGQQPDEVVEPAFVHAGFEYEAPL